MPLGSIIIVCAGQEDEFGFSISSKCIAKKGIFFAPGKTSASAIDRDEARQLLSM